MSHHSLVSERLTGSRGPRSWPRGAFSLDACGPGGMCFRGLFAAVSILDRWGNRSGLPGVVLTSYQLISRESGSALGATELHETDQGVAALGTVDVDQVLLVDDRSSALEAMRRRQPQQDIHSRGKEAKGEDNGLRLETDRLVNQDAGCDSAGPEGDSGE